jgi:hypothetical protein
MKDAHNITRRTGLAALATLAIFFGLFCLLWYAARHPDYGEEMFLFLGAILVHLLTTAGVLMLGSTWKRWLLLLIAIPCAFVAADRVMILVKVVTS